MELPRALIGTADGLWASGPDGLHAVEALAGQPVTALAVAPDSAHTWVLIGGRYVWARGPDGHWTAIAALPEDLAATCLAATTDGVLIGTEDAHLLRLAGGRIERVEAFDATPERAAWYTPWGDPADVRSIALDASGGAVYVNVHVGGVVRSRDGGRTWTPTLDIEVDVHQVLAHPTRAGVVLVAAAAGLGVSRDGGDTWRFTTAGLHAHYLRAVAVAGDRVLVSASGGPSGSRSTLYRGALDGAAAVDAGGALEVGRAGLPQWFRDNVDTACLAARDATAVFGTADGRVFTSCDGGATWELAGKGLPEVRCAILG